MKVYQNFLFLTIIIISLQQLSELLAMTMEQSSKSQSESDVDPTTLSESSNDFLKGEMRSLRENDIKGMHDDVKRVKSMLECNVCNQKGVESLLRELNEVKDLLLRSVHTYMHACRLYIEYVYGLS